MEITPYFSGTIPRQVGKSKTGTEVDAFLNQDIRSRIAELSTQDKAMTSAARDVFGIKQFHMF